MNKIIALSGSLREASYNSGLLRAACAARPDHVELASIADIPLYHGDREAADGVPDAVDRVKNQIASASGLLIATPEYNNSIPGVLKNALDWLSRPPKDIARVFHGKAVAVIGATPGGFGTVMAQDAMLPILRTLKTRPFFSDRLMVSGAGDRFNDSGQLTDEDTIERLASFIDAFIDFAG